MVTTLVQLGRTTARPLGLMVQVGRRRLVRRLVGLVLVVVTVRPGQACGPLRCWGLSR